MVRSILFPAATAAMLLTAPAPALADTGLAGFVDHTEWVSYSAGSGLVSLRVYPTPLARAAAARPDAGAESEQAWREVLVDAPEADTASMRDQFLCHWNYAEFARPGKTSWNLEPWRPEVAPEVMLASGCNPGGSEEPF
jgi:hypothetical protein